MHVQRCHATYQPIYLHKRSADYLVTVKGNQASLCHQPRSLLWSYVPAEHRERERARGKVTVRTTKTVMIQAGIDLPHAAQAMQTTRRTRPATTAGRWRTQVASAVTSVPSLRTGPEALGRQARRHRGINNRLHHDRDVTFTEDHSQLRTGTEPRIMAPLRNLVLSLYRINGNTNTAQATRRTARDPRRAPHLIDLTP